MTIKQVLEELISAIKIDTIQTHEEAITDALFLIRQILEEKKPEEKEIKLFQQGMKPLEFLLEGRKEGYNQALTDYAKNLEKGIE